MNGKECQETKWERLEKNKDILNIHAITHKPVHHITNGKKYEREVIYETIRDLNEIIEKKKNDLLFELPCKVGDTVYVGNLHTKISEIIIETDITFMCYFDCDWVIENVGCGDCPFADWYTTYEGDIDCQAMGCFSFTEKDIGKTVFLTKEEAEKALKGGAE